MQRWRPMIMFYVALILSLSYEETNEVTLHHQNHATSSIDILLDVQGNRN